MTTSFAVPLALACGLLIADPVAAHQTSPPLSANVRPVHPRLSGALRDGLMKSPTLRALVRALDASDVTVYLREGQCPGRAVACTILGGGIFGQTRVLHIHFRLGGAQRDVFLSFRDRLVAQIGHELQHALEIANHENVVDAVTMSALYARIGQRNSSLEETQYETEAAVRIGRLVLDEYRR